MIPLYERLAELGAHPRAVPWTLRLHSGFSAHTLAREYTLFAPPTADAARVVLQRMHNAVVLTSPAAAELEAPIEAERLEPFLGQLRAVHHVGIFLAGDAIRPSGQSFDLPSMDDHAVATPGDGLAAGLDIGGTGMKACVLRDGVVLRAASAPTWPDGAHGIDSLVDRARALLVEVAAGEPVGSLGVGFASPMGVDGRVVELSTTMREKVGDLAAFDGFAERVATAIVRGPVAMFNDLANLGRHLSARGERRFVRLQIGTSFGGCWIDANGTVFATEMGRLVVDAAPDAKAHPYLPITGAARSYLSTRGVAEELGGRLGRTLDPRAVGHELRERLAEGHPAAIGTLDQLAGALRGVVEELHAVLAGVTAVECGGSMLQGPAGKGLSSRLDRGLPVELRISMQPGHDGAVAAAMAPRVEARLKGLKRVG